MKQNVTLCGSLGDTLVSEVFPVSGLNPHKDVRKSARWKQCNITEDCLCQSGERCHSLYNLFHTELQNCTLHRTIDMKHRKL